jgi:hypothetical protein
MGHVVYILAARPKGERFGHGCYDGIGGLLQSSNELSKKKNPTIRAHDLAG